MAKVYGDEKGDRGQWEKLKGHPFKEKLQHFIIYYGLRTLAVVGGIAAAIYITVTIVRSKWPTTIAGEFLETPIYQQAVDDMHAYLTTQMELNPKKSHTDITSTVTTDNDGADLQNMIQKTFARVAVGDIDFLGAAETDLFDRYMSPEGKEYCAFEDLRVVLDDDTYNYLNKDGRLTWMTLDDGTTFPYMIDVTGTIFSTYFGIQANEYYIAYTVKGEHPEGFRLMTHYLFLELKPPK